jgi:hypothetical protein
VTPLIAIAGIASNIEACCTRCNCFTFEASELGGNHEGQCDTTVMAAVTCLHTRTPRDRFQALGSSGLTSQGFNPWALESRLPSQRRGHVAGECLEDVEV